MCCIMFNQNTETVTSFCIIWIVRFTPGTWVHWRLWVIIMTRVRGVAPKQWRLKKASVLKRVSFFVNILHGFVQCSFKNVLAILLIVTIAWILWVLRSQMVNRDKFCLFFLNILFKFIVVGNLGFLCYSSKNDYTPSYYCSKPGIDTIYLWVIF